MRLPRAAMPATTLAQPRRISSSLIWWLLSSPPIGGDDKSHQISDDEIRLGWANVVAGMAALGNRITVLETANAELQAWKLRVGKDFNDDPVEAPPATPPAS